MQGLARSRTPEPGKGEGAPRGIAEPAEAGTRGILAEQVALLYQGSFVAPVNLLNALIVAAALWNSFPRGVLVAWIGLTALVVGLRLALRRLYLGTAAAEREAGRWGRRFALGALLSGALWGALCAALPFLGRPFDFIFVTIVAAAMSAAAMTSLAPYFPAYLCYILPFIVPPGIAFIAAPGLHYSLLGALILVYAAVLIGTARNLNRTILRTLQLSNSLRSTHAELDSVRQGKWSSFAQLSHELRTPLTAILGFSEAMRDQIFGPLGNAKYEEYARHVHNSGQHLLTLTTEILDLSQAEAGELSLAESDISVAALVEDCAGLVAPRAETRELRILRRVSPLLPRLHGDETKIRQILLNLLSNAIKFTPPHGEIAISARLSREGGIALSVKDTGVGIAAADIPRALAPFVRLDNPLVHQTDGMGLGLPLCKRLAELHGAELAIESAPGRGTTCTIRFPPSRTRDASPSSLGRTSLIA